MEAPLISLAATPVDPAVVMAERDEARAQNGQLREQIADLKRQLDWFKRQLFGQKSERRGVEPPPKPRYPSSRSPPTATGSTASQIASTGIT